MPWDTINEKWYKIYAIYGCHDKTYNNSATNPSDDLKSLNMKQTYIYFLLIMVSGFVLELKEQKCTFSSLNITTVDVKLKGISGYRDKNSHNSATITSDFFKLSNMVQFYMYFGLLSRVLHLRYTYRKM